MPIAASATWLSGSERNDPEQDARDAKRTRGDAEDAEDAEDAAYFSFKKEKYQKKTCTNWS